VSRPILHDVSSSPNLIRVIKSRRMRWAGHVARMGTGEVLIRFWWGDLRERNHLEDLGVDGRIILKCTFNKCDVEAWTRFIWLWIERVVGLL